MGPPRPLIPISGGGMPLVGGPPGLPPTAGLPGGIPIRGAGAIPGAPGRTPFGGCEDAGPDGSRLAPKVRAPTVDGNWLLGEPEGEAMSRERIGGV